MTAAGGRGGAALGPLRVIACTSWSFPVRGGGRELLAVDICGLTLFPFVPLVEPDAYPGIRTDLERSFTTLRSLPADIFLGAQRGFFGLDRKRRLRRAERTPTPAGILQEPEPPRHPLPRS